MLKKLRWTEECSWDKNGFVSPLNQTQALTKIKRTTKKLHHSLIIISIKWCSLEGLTRIWRANYSRLWTSSPLLVVSVFLLLSSPFLSSSFSSFLFMFLSQLLSMFILFHDSINLWMFYFSTSFHSFTSFFLFICPFYCLFFLFLLLCIGPPSWSIYWNIRTTPTVKLLPIKRVPISFLIVLLNKFGKLLVCCENKYLQ